MTKTRRQYTVKKIYIVTCSECNEDITRPLSGEDAETRADVERLIIEHDETWHLADPGP